MKQKIVYTIGSDERDLLDIVAEFDNELSQEDRQLIMRIYKNLDMALALWDIQSRMFKLLSDEYEWRKEEGHSETWMHNPLAMMDEIRTRINDILERNNIEINELTS